MTIVKMNIEDAYAIYSVIAFVLVFTYLISLHENEHIDI